MENHDEELKLLANLIVDEVKSNFAVIHRTGNILKSISVEKINESEYNIVIDPEIYDELVWRKEKIIKPTGEGSYASEVDVTGGPSQAHKDYMNLAIERAIVKWLTQTKHHPVGYGER